jgi:hypothetical protein
LSIFFEIIGAYVKNGYVPMRDVRQLYKGPVLDCDMVFRGFIGDWQQEAHMAPGLLENALYLMDRMRKQENHAYVWWLY